jgi:hypothetical protein
MRIPHRQVPEADLGSTTRPRNRCGDKGTHFVPSTGNPADRPKRGKPGPLKNVVEIQTAIDALYRGRETGEHVIIVTATPRSAQFDRDSKE